MLFIFSFHKIALNNLASLPFSSRRLIIYVEEDIDCLMFIVSVLFSCVLVIVQIYYFYYYCYFAYENETGEGNKDGANDFPCHSRD